MQTPSVSKEIWIFSGIIALLLCLGLFLQLIVFRGVTSTGEYTGVITEEIMPSPSDDQEYKLVAGTDMRGEFLLEPNSLWKIYPDIAPRELEVHWLDTPRFIDMNGTEQLAEYVRASLGQNGSGQPLRVDFDYTCVESEEWMCTLYVYEMGVVSTVGEWFGRSVYLVFFPQPGMGIYMQSYFVLFDTDVSNKFVVIDSGALQVESASAGSYNVPVYDDGSMLSRVFLGSVPSVISNLRWVSFPSELSVGEYGTLLFSRHEYKEREVDEFFIWGSSRTPEANLFGIYDMSTGERNPIVKTQTMLKTDEYDFAYLDRGAFIVDDPLTRSRGLYEFIPYFLTWPDGQEEKNMYAGRFIPIVNWTDGRGNTDDTFVLGGQVKIGGCQHGVVPFSNIISNQPWFHVSDLKQVGVTQSKGEPVYVAANPQQHVYYRELFDYGFDGSRLYDIGEDYEEKTKELHAMSEEERYAQFLADNPVFFWKDPMGNWRVYQKSKYQSLAECGKPVIYLYPEETTDVNVQVVPNGGFTITIPEYPVGGWNVKAEPNGALTSYDDGKPYPYLFWEGHANGFEYSDKGFVFTQDEVESGMKDVLARFGMNEQETADFLEFWLPKMVEKPYVFVTFADQRDFERAAPLKIAPKPDSVLRVFMYFEGLDAPRTVEPLSITPFVRKGFSVVEWGGVLFK